MAVALLRGENFRLFRSFELRPGPGMNLVLGDNAAGKTTLLESLHVLTRGRSFRSANHRECVGAAGGDWSLFLETADAVRIGARGGAGALELRRNSEAVRMADVLHALPLQAIDPGTHRLVDEGPANRRSFIDWGVFHVEHRFLDTWRRFQRALDQRNRALRNQASDSEVAAWEPELVSAGELLDVMRQGHLDAVASTLPGWIEKLLGAACFEWEWRRGWQVGQAYGDVLREARASHRKLGNTTQGPHRAELLLSLAGRTAKGHASRGQQKLLIASLVFAQAEVVARHAGVWPVLLLDDFASELAPPFQERLAGALEQYPGQSFVTAFDRAGPLRGVKAAVFHVEHGTIHRSD